MTDRQLLFQLAAEAPWPDTDPPWQWATLDMPPFTHFPISLPLSDDGIGSLVASLCDPLDLKPHTDTHRILDELASLDSYSLRGGLRIMLGDQAIVSHGCCSGLEDWRELFTILEGESPWMGHDPDSWCDFLSNRLVRFWSAGGVSAERHGGHIDCSLQFVSNRLPIDVGAYNTSTARLVVVD